MAILPLLALLIIFGGFDIFVQQDMWPLFFIISGGLVTLGGFIGIFLIKESNVQKSEISYLKTIVYGFKPSTVKKHILLYLFLIGMSIFGISTQIYMPYFIIYMQRYLGIDSYAIVLGAVLLLASVVSVLVGRFIKEHNKNKFFLPAMVIMGLGLIMLFITRDVFLVGISGVVMMSGNLILSTAFNVKIRDYTPLDKVGHFQGIRMIFYVMIPMIIGPFIGARVINEGNLFYDDLGIMKPVPTPEIFIASAIALILIVIPIFFAFKKEKVGEMV